MKTHLSLLRNILMFSIAGINISLAQNTFDFSYNTVYDANADEYLLQNSNATKWDEVDYNTTYYSATSLGNQATLLYEFPFSAPSTTINLAFDVYVNNDYNPYNNGFASVDASRDGSTWVNLYTPNYGSPLSSTFYYDQNVPEELTGTSDFYLRITLLTQGDVSQDPHFAQFSRVEDSTAATTPVFEIDAALVSEPTPLELLFFGLLSLVGIVHCRKNLSNISAL